MGKISGRGELMARPLAKNEWSLNYDACIDCKSTERRHTAKGRCFRCHHGYRYHNDAEYRERCIAKASVQYIKRFDKIVARKKRRTWEERKAWHKRHLAKYRDAYGGRIGCWHKGIIVKSGQLVGMTLTAAYRRDTEWVVAVELDSTKAVIELPTKQLTKIGRVTMEEAKAIVYTNHRYVKI